jgi:acyl-CoA reductase-like NAD-dependent aldehyde dehydrogenase
MIPSSAASSTDNDDLEATIDLLRARMQAAHDSGANLSFHSWRLQALINLQTLVSENHEEIANALYEDLGKERTEAYASEIRLVENEIAYFIKNLKAWLQPTSVPSPLACLPSYSTVRLRPLAPPGVLILGPCNYPFLLCMQPAIGALAAGNPTLLKPSEACPATCHLLEKLVNKYFDPSVLTVLLGDAKTSMALTKRQWGMIFFTGSGRVGTFVAQAAANTLTPTVLELGGKCPVIVDETASCLDNTVRLQQIAHRIIWAKCWNTGQTCAAVDYVLIQENYFETLCQALVKALELQYGGNADCQTSELGRLVSVDHAQRQFDLILEIEQRIASKTAPANCKILVGGSQYCKVQERFIAPTLIINPPLDSRLMQEEIFGPILPIFSFSRREQVAPFVKSVAPTPLCLYVYTNSKSVFDEYCQHIPSGSAMRNDGLIHLVSSHLPFGGLGSSGYGKYHGKHSLEVFSHTFSTMERPLGYGLDWGQLRCHPFQPNGREEDDSRWLQVKRNVMANIILKLPNLPVMDQYLLWLLIVILLFATWITFGAWTRSGNFSFYSVASILAETLERVAQSLRHFERLSRNDCPAQG